MKLNVDWQLEDALEKIGIGSHEHDNIELVILRMAQAIHAISEELGENN